MSEFQPSLPPNKNMLARDLSSLHFSVNSSQKLLLLPIASIACGKSTLGRLLCTLFPIVHHIQSDDTGRAFKHIVMNQFKTHQIIYADKNNHLKQHRREICQLFRKSYPDGIVLALDWNVTPTQESMDRIGAIAKARVEERGENHQTLTPMKSDYMKVIRMFIMQRDVVDLETEDDGEINYVLDLDIENDPKGNLRLLLNALKWEQPSEEGLLAAEEKVKKVVVLPNENFKPSESTRRNDRGGQGIRDDRNRSYGGSNGDVQN
ncbi:hypothetical protein HK098_008334 [Nowakowskiella sp. JEL0407]|nr:hypothetical protein HK098_008334 [Nowakowskiella sp. JEL0407]